MSNPSTIKITGRYYRRYPPVQPLGYAEEELSLDPDHTVFFIVDVYGLGFDEDHNYGNVDEFYKCNVEAHQDIVVNHIKPAKVAAKKLGLPVVYVTNYLAPSTTEWLFNM